MTHRKLTFLLVAISVIASVNAGLLCPLCGSLDKVPTRWDYPVSAGATCRTIYLQMASMSIDDARCSVQQEQYQSVCCDEELPPAYAPAPTPAGGGGGAGGPPGNEPECKICQNDNYPGNPTKIINARYVGTYSCGTLYYRGLNGNIPGFMCGPLQDYAYGECDCANGKPPSVPSATSPPTSPPMPIPIPAPTSVSKKCKRLANKCCNKFSTRKQKYNRCTKNKLKNTGCNLRKTRAHVGCFD